MRECFSLNAQNIKNSNIDWGYSMDICHINESSVKKHFKIILALKFPLMDTHSPALK